ncbi:MAG TPA: acetoacetate decarboxylase family protein [Polyangiales bacterium]
MHPSSDPKSSNVVAPAPWQLRAEAYAFLVGLPLPRGRAELFVPSELTEARFGPWGVVAFIEYSESDVGPYYELLFIPGSFRFGKRWLPSITKIYVSSRASVDNGRRNWGIPKELADFEVDDGRDGVKRVTMRVDGVTAVELWLRHGKVQLPFSTRVLPNSMFTLGQRLGGQTFEVTPKARGLAQRAKVLHAWSEPGMFCELSAERVGGAARLSKVELQFPTAVMR